MLKAFSTVTFALACLAWQNVVQAQYAPAIKAVQPIMLAEYPHDREAFTQGLVLHRGRFFESTGLYGKSSLREIEVKTGRVIRKTALSSKLFGEGLAIQAGKLVQLTWKEGVALKWPLEKWREPRHLSFEGEGWGLTSWKDGFVMSNGSDTLQFRSRDFRPLRRLAVTLAGKPLNRLNELESARGRIYANLWYSDSVVAIDARSGEVVQVVDCRDLVLRSGRANPDAVLNGIAWDSAKDIFYLTGKLWPKVFAVRIPK